MHLAAQDCHESIVEMLVTSGADIDVGNQVRKGYLLVIRHASITCVYYIRTLQDDCVPLHLAAQNNHITVVQTLIKLGADVNAADKVSYCVHACTYLTLNS